MWGRPLKKKYDNHKNVVSRTSLVVWQLRLYASTAGGSGSIPVQGTKIPHTMQHGKTKNEPTKHLLSIFCTHTVFQVWRYQPHDVFIPEVTDHNMTYTWTSTLAHVVLLPVPGLTLLPKTNRHTNKNQENIWKVFTDISHHTAQDCEISEK